MHPQYSRHMEASAGWAAAANGARRVVSDMPKGTWRMGSRGELGAAILMPHEKMPAHCEKPDGPTTRMSLEAMRTWLGLGLVLALGLGLAL